VKSISYLNKFADGFKHIALVENITWIQIYASSNHRKEKKAEPCRL